MNYDTFITFYFLSCKSTKTFKNNQNLYIYTNFWLQAPLEPTVYVKIEVGERIRR